MKICISIDMEAHSIFVAYSRLLNLHVNLADVIPISLAISADFTSTDDSEYRSNTGNPVLPARLGSLGRMRADTLLLVTYEVACKPKSKYCSNRFVEPVATWQLFPSTSSWHHAFLRSEHHDLKLCLHQNIVLPTHLTVLQSCLTSILIFSTATI